MGSTKGRQAYPVVLLAPPEDDSKVRVAGPQDARPVRELSAGRVLDLLETSRSLVAREAASFLGRELSRLEEAVVPVHMLRVATIPRRLPLRMPFTLRIGYKVSRTTSTSTPLDSALTLSDSSWTTAQSPVTMC